MGDSLVSRPPGVTIQMSRTSAWASFWCAQAAYPHLKASDQGRLVLVTSPSGVEGSANIPLYSPAKAAQRALAKSLAREWGPDGITANCIAPVAETPALASAFSQVATLRGAIEARTPLGRIGDPVTDKAVYDASSPMTYIRQAKAPLLVLQGENDIRVPMGQAQEVVATLKAAGATVDAKYYPAEGHGFVKRENQIDALQRTVDWLDKHLKK